MASWNSCCFWAQSWKPWFFCCSVSRGLTCGSQLSWCQDTGAGIPVYVVCGQSRGALILDLVVSSLQEEEKLCSIFRLTESVSHSLWFYKPECALNAFFLKLVRVDSVLCNSTLTNIFQSEKVLHIWPKTNKRRLLWLERKKNSYLTDEIPHIGPNYPKTGPSTLSLSHRVSRVRPPGTKDPWPLDTHSLSSTSYHWTLPWFCRWDGTSSHEASTTDPGGAGGKQQRVSELLFPARDFHFFQYTLLPAESQPCYLMGSGPGAIVHRPTAWGRKGKSPQTNGYQRKRMEKSGVGRTAPEHFQFCFYLHFRN